ncbi:MAG: MogA/MoaB family molybdenum cofactor biosynthesis protein [Mycobacteriales bacterium]
MTTLPDDALAVVITVSDRSAAAERADTSGPEATKLLTQQGFQVRDVVVVADERAAIVAALRAAVSLGADLVCTTGGTGLNPRDVTPEATAEVIERPAPGIADAIRASGGERVPTSILSRGVAGVCARTLIVNLPGSTGGVRDGIAALAPVVAHAVQQLRGGDH